MGVEIDKASKFPSFFGKIPFLGIGENFQKLTPHSSNPKEDVGTKHMNENKRIGFLCVGHLYHNDLNALDEHH